jgi:hypothetical protein
MESKKHKINVINTGSIIPCEYCHKEFRTLGNLKRHQYSCRKKIEHNIIQEKDDMINNLEMKMKKIAEEKNQLEEYTKKVKQKNDLLEEDRRRVEEELMNFMKDLVKSNNKVSITNNKTINMFHVMNNYTNAKNYDEIMDQPLTEDEKKKLITLGAEYTPGEILESRCITNLSAEERPIHCVDASRDKYIIRKDDNWLVDNDGRMIMEGTFKFVKQLYLDNAIEDMRDVTKNGYDIEGVDKVINNQKSAAYIVDHRKDKKILGNLKDKIPTKNII